MRVLWITHIEFPEATNLLTGSGELKSTGGWLLGMADALMEIDEGITLCIAMVSHRVKKMTRLQGEKFTYYLIPYGKGALKKNNDYIPYWKRINEEFYPDVVHIHGTEFSHGLAYVDACGAENVVVSMQGIKSAIAPYFFDGLKKWDFIRNITFHDILRGTSIKEQEDFRKQGIYEKELLQKVYHIIGRTSWDRARTWAINPKLQYHFCNEVLRREFYDGASWKYESCIKHSIFISQAGYPVKGLHQLLKAIPLVLSKYPDTIIRVAGKDITRNKTINEKLRLSSYGKIIKRIIDKLGISSSIKFVGNLNAEDMKKEYLSCNVFVCPSTIENSPNSLGEAQILGVPCIASYVGGIPDMMKGDEENLFRFSEIEMLAFKICELFAKQDVDTSYIKSLAKVRHERMGNARELLKIYSKVID